MPSFVIFNSRFNLADHIGSATTSTLATLIKSFTGTIFIHTFLPILSHVSEETRYSNKTVSVYPHSTGIISSQPFNRCNSINTNDFALECE